MGALWYGQGLKKASCPDYFYEKKRKFVWCRYVYCAYNNYNLFINNIMFLHKPSYRPPRCEELAHEEESIICLSGDVVTEPYENSGEDLTW